MPILDGISYPDKLNDVIKEKELGKLFVSYIKRIGLTETLLFAMKRQRNQTMTETLLVKKAIKVTVPPKVIEDLAHIHGQIGTTFTWDSPTLTGLVDDAKEAVHKALGDEHVKGYKGFYGSKEFQKHHDAHLRSAVDHQLAAAVAKKDINSKTLKALGFKSVKDAKVHKWVHKMAEGFAANDKSTALRAYQEVRLVDRSLKTPFTEMKKLMVKAKVIPA